MSNNSQNHSSQNPWPELPTAAWRDTYETLHLWTQIVGKIRLARTPWLNHSWHVALYVTGRGLTTSPIPADAVTFQIDLDFIDHALRISTSGGARREFALAGQSVASFYAAVMTALAELGIHIAIDEMPNELPEPIRFSQDNRHASYDPDAVRRFFQILANADRVFKQFRTGFLGKASPVHFFWGSFDLAVTRFSGRRAPRHPGGVPHLSDDVACEAYSREVSSAGFWPGSGDGQPLVAVSKLQSRTPLPERVATTDLFHVVARKAQAAGLTFYMFGADETENAAAVAKVRNMYPRLRIVGSSHGYLRGQALRDKVDEINALAPDYLWVALGVPYEQAFVDEFTPQLANVGVIKTSGGLFNFLSGSCIRAPLWMQRVGLEWAWRIWLEPRRLFWRYFTTNPRALLLLFNGSRSTDPAPRG